MVVIMRRKEINELVEVIKALAYKDLSFIVSHPDEALYSLGLVIDNKKLRHRAQHILQMVEVMPVESIESRRLWKNSEFCQIVLDLMQTIDVEVDKVEMMERKIEEIHVNASNDIAQEESKVIKNGLVSIDEIVIDRRWTEKTIPLQLRKRCYDIEPYWSDYDILDYIGYYDKCYKDTGLTNKEMYK